MKKQIIVLLCLVAVIAGGCKDFLAAVPEKDLKTPDSVFETREGADQWLTSAYNILVSGFIGNIMHDVALCGADEYVGNEMVRTGTSNLQAFYIPDGLQMVQDPYFNFWTDKTGARPYYHIRLINDFLEKIGDVYNLLPGELELWTAEAKALKAFIYFELVKRYGPIVLVPENIGVNAPLEKMRVPRSHVDICFKEIISLLDQAIPDLPLRNSKLFERQGHFALESAVALKAKVLLYAASPLFNGNVAYSDFKDKEGQPYFNTSYEPEKWKKAALALDSAISICEAAGYRLIEGNGSRSTALLNTMQDIEQSVFAPQYVSTEAVFIIRMVSSNNWRHLLPKLQRFTLDDNGNLTTTEEPHYSEDAYGTLAVNMKMAELCYTENGLPIDFDNTWNHSVRYQMGIERSNKYKNVVALNENVLNLHLKREPRFYANIAGDGMYWLRGKGTNDNLLVRAYRGKRFGIQESRVISSVPQNISGYWCKKFLRSDFHTKNYSTDAQQLGSDNGFPVIRLADLYLMQAEAWNEYEGPSQKVYDAINKVRTRAGIPTVEVAWADYSKAPAMVNTKDGMRTIIQRERAIELMFEGHRFWDLRRWFIAHENLNTKPVGWSITGKTPQEFFNNFTYPKVIWNRAEFRSPRDYLFPIKSEEAMISGYVQNPGWGSK